MLKGSWHQTLIDTLLYFHILYKNIKKYKNYAQQHSSVPSVSFEIFSSEHHHSCVSHFSKPISINPWLWWQMTGDRLLSCGDWQGRLFHLWRSPLHLSNNTAMCTRRHKDTDTMCVLQMAEAVLLYSCYRGRSQVTQVMPTGCPSDLCQWLQLSQLCQSFSCWTLL